MMFFEKHKNPSEEIKIKCDCGSDKFVVVDAKVKGIIQLFGDMMRPMPIEDGEVVCLTLCAECARAVDFMLVSDITG